MAFEQTSAPSLLTPSGRKLRGFIFDMDGTLFDSERFWLRTWKMAEKEFGFTGSEAMFLHTSGSSQTSMPQAYVDFFHGDRELAQRVYEYRTHLARTQWTGPEGPPKAGARELLAALWEAGFPTALATSSPREHVDILFRASDIPLRFQTILSGDLGLPSKPEPHIFLTAAQRLGLPITDCAVVEDSQNGILAAIASGAYSVLIPDQVPPVPQVQARADVVLNTLWELGEHLGLPLPAHT